MTAPIKTVNSLEEGFDHLRGFGTRVSNSGFNYSMMVEDPKTLKLNIYQALKQPCYGNLRKYGPTSTEPNVSKPSDLKMFTYPVGRTLGIAITFYNSTSLNRPEVGLMFDREVSPWRGCLKDAEILYGDEKKTKVVGLLFKDTSFDPYIAVSLMRRSGQVGAATGPLNIWELLDTVKDKVEPYIRVSIGSLFYSFSLGGTNTVSISQQSLYDICSTCILDLTKWLTGNVELHSGGTWLDGYDYTRPKLEKIFVGDGVKNPLAPILGYLSKNNFRVSKFEGFVEVVRDTLNTAKHKF